ncbi:hypothetical protein NEMBOFW57_007053 [Staphylotrichum longicolle]|uniref:Transmembrane protein n=1 Tax=Staphylotrichum longicolle TaxID=669026 RepID=A0AAD4EUB3_9PEZI|nr:hypothetical protein NEMBOFW57_007053 [Staphylotrichum longicolle]
MNGKISVPLAIIAIVVTAVGTCFVSLLGYYLFIRRRRAKHQAHEEEKEVNAALDRAIVSYIVKEHPSPQEEVAPGGPSQPELAMTTAVGATMDDAHDDGLSHYEPPTPTGDQRLLLRRTETSVTEASRSLRQTASSHFMDSAERVYANILAQPLEHIRVRPPPQMAEPAPAPRDDVGWPLTSKESWL